MPRPVTRRAVGPDAVVGLKLKATLLPLFNLDGPAKAGDVVLATSLTAAVLDPTSTSGTQVLLPFVYICGPKLDDLKWWGYQGERIRVVALPRVGVNTLITSSWS